MAKLMRALQVQLVDFRGNGDKMLKVFIKATAPLVLAARRNSRFSPKPTRAARKRRGKELEKRRVALELLERPRDDR